MSSIKGSSKATVIYSTGLALLVECGSHLYTFEFPARTCQNVSAAQLVDYSNSKASNSHGFKKCMIAFIDVLIATKLI